MLFDELFFVVVLMQRGLSMYTSACAHSAGALPRSGIRGLRLEAAYPDSRGVRLSDSFHPRQTPDLVLEMEQWSERRREPSQMYLGPLQVYRCGSVK